MLFIAALVIALGIMLIRWSSVLVAVVNATIGYFQENKAEKALEDIQKMLSPTAQVLRDGVRKEVEASELTVGDIVLLSPGDKVPADVTGNGGGYVFDCRSTHNPGRYEPDLRLIWTDNLKIEESPLTGESILSKKNTAVLGADTMLGDKINMAFSGTTVTAGTGMGVVVATGEETEIGRINKMMSEVEKVTTPLLRQTDTFGKVSLGDCPGGNCRFCIRVFLPQL